MAGESDDNQLTTGSMGKRSRRRALLTSCTVLALGGAILWLVRTPIAENLVNDQLQQRNVTATYRIEAIGPRTQRLADLVIGDPLRPDLIARRVELDLRWTWSGPEIAAIRAEGVRLSARWADGRLQMGEVDKLLPPPSTETFAFADVALMLRDARARIVTPWGAFGARADGNGSLRDNFRGTIAIVTEALATSDCRVGRTTAYGDVRIIDGKPGFTGPLRVSTAKCSAPKLALTRIESDIDIALEPDFAKWQGRVNARGSGLSMELGELASFRITGDFSGAGAQSTLTFKASGRRLALSEVTIGDIAANGTAVIGTGATTGTAAMRFSGAALTRDMQRRLASAIGKGQAAVVGPLITRMGAALTRAAADFGGEGDVTLALKGSDLRIDISTPELQSASGAAVRAGPASLVTLAMGQRETSVGIEGAWTLNGGGLPTTQLAINRSSNGSTRGRLMMGPLLAGSTRLALAPVAFSLDRKGQWQLNSRAMLSGDVAGGRVEGLGFAINATIDQTGRFALASGCQLVTVNTARLAGVQLGQNSVRLCSAGGQPLMAYSAGVLGGELVLPDPAIAGFRGQTPLRARASEARYSLQSGEWTIADLVGQLGEDDAISPFSAAMISGAPEGNGQAGLFQGGAGGLAAVPLDIREVEGNWHWSDDQLTIAAKLLVDDRNASQRFATLVSRDAALQFANGKIDARAVFAERETGTVVGRTEIRHDFDTEAGSADLIVSALRFNNLFQPDQLTPLALGVIANTDGSLAGRGRVDWVDAKVTSGGSFSTAGSDFAAAFGSVRGASTTIVFDDLLGVHTPPGQRISLDEVNPGFPVFGGTIDYQMLDSTNIRIEGGRWPFAGGELVLKPTTLDFDVNAVRRLEFELNGVDAAIFLSELGFDNINASGVFDGVLPVEFSGLGGRIVGGRLVARGGGGQVAYVGELSNYNLGTMANFAFNMLKSLRYEAMEISLNGDLDGEMLTDVRITGLSQGKGASRNIITRQLEKLPIEFNVRIDAPFRQLITSAKSLYDPTVLGTESLYSLIESRRAVGEKAVQPPESEGVPK